MEYIQVRDLIFKDSNPKICVTITGITDFQILNDLENLRYYDFDLIELRIDYYENVENFDKIYELLQKIRKVYNKTLLFTFRTKDEGGMFDMNDEKYFSLNQFIIESGLIDLIDIELFSNEEKILETIIIAKKNDVKVIMSNHDFNKTPSKKEIVKRLIKMQEYNADITKIAVMPKHEKDILTLLAAAVEMKNKKGDRPFITIAMGSMGLVTRLTGQLFGSCLTYVTLNKSSAPGQINVKNAREILALLQM